MIRIERVPVEPHPDLTITEQWSVTVDGTEQARMCVVDVAGTDYVSFDVRTLSPAHAVRAVLRMRQWLSARDRPVSSVVDVERFPGAERLDGLLGFRPTDDMVMLPCGRQMRVWRWQSSQR